MHPEKDWSVRTGPVIAVKKNNKFLLLKRSKNETYSGLWEFPAGGIEFFESMQNAAERELKEETGLTAKNVEYLGYHERWNKEFKKYIIAHDFLVTRFEGNVKISDEHDEWKWVSEEKILKMENVGIDTLKVLEKIKEKHKSTKLTKEKINI